MVYFSKISRETYLLTYYTSRWWSNEQHAAAWEVKKKWGSVSCSVMSDSLQPHELRSRGSSVHRILPARILEHVAVYFFRGSSWPRDQTGVPYISGRLFTVWATREADVWERNIIFQGVLTWTPWEGSYSFLSSNRRSLPQWLKQMSNEGWTDCFSSHKVHAERCISQDDFSIPQYVNIFSITRR